MKKARRGLFQKLYLDFRITLQKHLRSGQEKIIPALVLSALLPLF